MSKKLAELFGALAEGLEGAATAARALEAGYGNAKSGGDSEAVDDVASSDAGSKGKKGAAAGKVAAKPAKGGKAKPPAVTFDDLKTKMTELMTLKGKEVVKSIMSEFGAAKLVDVEEENFADMMEKVTAAMADDEEEGGEDDDMFGP